MVKKNDNKNHFSYDSRETNDRTNNNLRGTSLENNVSEVTFFSNGEEAMLERRSSFETKKDAAKKGKENADDFRKNKRKDNSLLARAKTLKRNDKNKAQKPTGRGNDKTQKYIPLDKGEAR